MSDIIQIQGVKLRPPPVVDDHLGRALHDGTYEEAEVRALSGILKPDDIVMELGTGLGLVSTFCALRTSGDRVFTFEANPDLEPHIRANYALNGVNPQLQICMLTDREGEQTFYINNAFWESSTRPNPKAKRVVSVPTRPLNEQIRRINPTVLVMDIEGGESELIPIIDFHTISRVVIELHERMMGREKANAVVARFYKAGFRINRQLTSWEICCFEQVDGDNADPRTHVSLDEYLADHWRLAGGFTASGSRTLAEMLPTGCRFALVDDDQGGLSQPLPGRERVPFPDHDGQYSSPPDDDASAIAELDRLRAQGLSFIIFRTPALWWLKHYSGLAKHLRTAHRCVLEDETFVAFALQS
jgi:FkbM family methyltransferase